MITKSQLTAALNRAFSPATVSRYGRYDTEAENIKAQAVDYEADDLPMGIREELARAAADYCQAEIAAGRKAPTFEQALAMVKKIRARDAKTAAMDAGEVERYRKRLADEAENGPSYAAADLHHRVMLTEIAKRQHAKGMFPSLDAALRSNFPTA